MSGPFYPTTPIRYAEQCITFWLVSECNLSIWVEIVFRYSTFCFYPYLRPSPLQFATQSTLDRRSFSTRSPPFATRSPHQQSDGRFEVTTDVKSQLKFLSDLDRLEKERQDEQERERLLKAAKSRSKMEDPEQLSLKQKAKELQLKEAEQRRHEEANETALAAIGPRKKKAKLGDEVSCSWRRCCCIFDVEDGGRNSLLISKRVFVTWKQSAIKFLLHGSKIDTSFLLRSYYICQSVTLFSALTSPAPAFVHG